MALVEIGEWFGQLVERVPPVDDWRRLARRHEPRDGLHVLLGQFGDEEHGLLAAAHRTQTRADDVAKGLDLTGVLDCGSTNYHEHGAGLQDSSALRQGAAAGDVDEYVLSLCAPPAAI